MISSKEYERMMIAHPDRAVIEDLYARKTRWEDYYAYAELTKPVGVRSSVGVTSRSADVEVLPAGTTVLITTVSRLGDLCFRRGRLDELDELNPGYEGRALPDHFMNVRLAGTAGDGRC